MQEEPHHFTFFMDDFGTRTMCKPGDPFPMEAHIYSFALGGVIVPSEAVPELAQAISEFCKRWEVPELHGNKIRSGKGKFSFLKKDEERRNAFFQELESLIIDERITVHACVICRPDYRDRYFDKHSEGSRWQMSRTAFDIAVERAAKFARLHGRKLSVAYERSGAVEDRLLEGYFAHLANSGTAFDAENSSIHKPLTKQQLADTLTTIWPDGKNNQMLQLADLALHPVSHRPTGLKNRAYERLAEAGQIIDFRNQGDGTIAVKYSCYDGAYKDWVNPRNT